MPFPNTTLVKITNETSVDQQNSPCYPFVSTAEQISKLLAYSLILLTSCFGNIFIVAMVYKRRELRKTINYFIVNMALSDLVFSLTNIPVEIMTVATDSWRWHITGTMGLILCKFWSCTKLMSYFVSVQSLVWIAVDRFVAVLCPMKIGLISTKIRISAIACSWIMAFSFVSPLLYTWGLVNNSDKTYCSPINNKSVFPNQKAVSVYFWLNLTFAIFAPLFFLTLTYTAIALTLRRQTKILQHTPPNFQRDSSRRRKRAVQMSVVITVLFYICVIPQALLYFINYWKQSCAFVRIFSITADFLFVISSSVNPIICLSCVESYRRGLKNILCSCRKTRSNKIFLYELNKEL